MTEKEKAEAYDEAIMIAKKLYSNGIAEEIFHELKESEDDKIRKEIISILRNAYWTSNKNRFNELIAWLEKQIYKDKLIQDLGEYKVRYTQKVLEKYVNNMSNKDDERLRKTIIAFLKDFAEQVYENAVECIDSLDKKNYQVSNGKGNYNYFPISKQDEMHIWTIQDANDGDVLSWDDNKCIALFKNIYDKYSFNSYGFVGHCTGTFEPRQGYHDIEGAHPATKEQRDFLFQKIKEAGYKWNTEKKTLEKLVEPKFKVGDKIVNLQMKYMGGSLTQVTISKITDDKYIFTDGSYIPISSQDSWELVHDKKVKFDPKTLQPYDKVLVRRGNENYNVWFPDFVSDPPNNDNNKTLCMCIRNDIAMVIPYNNDTKHLIGTTDEAPEFYKYWKD